MQAAKDFMREFFQERIVEHQREMANRAPFRRRFFASDCKWDSRSRTLEEMQSEDIVSVDEANSKAKVITLSKSPFFKAGAQEHRKRYHLQPMDNSWLIRFVEIECPVCHGLGDANCISCKGTHWRGCDMQPGSD
jgi:hypothetical protein